jgi:uncharacterized protein YndB with AHSA1/START domain
MTTTKITIKTTVEQPLEQVWAHWTQPEHITQWNQASEDWHCPKASNDLRVGGQFSSTMAAKDGSFSFDFGGTYNEVEPQKRLRYTLEDGRVVSIDFTADGPQTHIVETFDPETENPAEMQRAGWQAILDNFKAYSETH